MILDNDDDDYNDIKDGDDINKENTKEVEEDDEKLFFSKYQVS